MMHMRLEQKAGNKWMILFASSLDSALAAGNGMTQLSYAFVYDSRTSYVHYNLLCTQ